MRRIDRVIYGELKFLSLNFPRPFRFTEFHKVNGNLATAELVAAKKWFSATEANSLMNLNFRFVGLTDEISDRARSNNRTASSIVPLFMRRWHFIGQDVLVSAILDSKVYRRLAYQPAEQHSPKRGRDIAIGGEDGSAPWIGVRARNRSPRNLDPRSMRGNLSNVIS